MSESVPGQKPESHAQKERAKEVKWLERLAFHRAEHCVPLLKRFWELEAKSELRAPTEALRKIHQWLLAPLSLWPIDMEGLAKHVLERVESGRELEDDLSFLLDLLDEPPSKETQAAVAEFEHYVQSGRYERLVKQPEKFEEQEKALLRDEQLKRAWKELKRRFETSQFRNARGVIRRRMSQERNFRDGWEFDWKDAGRRFQLCFDAMCYRWKLYGMEGDRPLLLKVSVNPTPHGTMIVIPRHWSLDPYRDLDWKFIGRLHRVRGARRQGPKLSAGRVRRMEEAKVAKRLWVEARARGLKGMKRYEYVRERMGRDVRMDPGWLKRLLGEAG